MQYQHHKINILQINNTACTIYCRAFICQILQCSIIAIRLSAQSIMHTYVVMVVTHVCSAPFTVMKYFNANIILAMLQ